MAALVRRFTRAIRPMTEPDAYLAFVFHQRECGVCGAPAGTKTGGRTDRRCEVGLELFNQWQAAQARQSAGTQPIRHREPAGRR